LQERATKVNPFIEFVKKAAVAMGETDVASIEEILNKLANSMLDSREEF